MGREGGSERGLQKISESGKKIGDKKKGRKKKSNKK